MDFKLANRKSHESEMVSQPERLTEDSIQTIFATPINTQLRFAIAQIYFKNNFLLFINNFLLFLLFFERGYCHGN